MAGFWKLDTADSDDPVGRLQATRHATGGLGGGGNDEPLLKLIRPADSLDIALKGPEVDLTDNQGNKLILYTDGRKIQKSNEANVQEISARWKGSQLISNERTPQGRKMARTLELSPTGLQLFEIWHIDTGPESSAAIWYTYDAASQPPE